MRAPSEALARCGGANHKRPIFVRDIPTSVTREIGAASVITRPLPTRLLIILDSVQPIELLQVIGHELCGYLIGFGICSHLNKSLQQGCIVIGVLSLDPCVDKMVQTPLSLNVVSATSKAVVRNAQPLGLRSA